MAYQPNKAKGEKKRSSSKEALNDDEFASQVRELVRGSASMNYGDLAEQRIRAMDYYLGRPFGDEVRGRSQVVSTDVADTVEGLLPYLMKIFTGSDRVVEVTPTREDTVELAEQATDYLNWLFYKKNNGFLVLYEFFKDALLQKNGVIKYWREQIEQTTTEEFIGLTLTEITYLLKEPNISIVDQKSYPDPMNLEPVLYDVKIERYQEWGEIKVQAVAPEEFVVNRRHNSLYLQDARMVCHRTRKTASDLAEMGYDEDEIEACEASDDWETLQEEMARDVDGASAMGDDLDYGTTDGVYFYDEIYVKVDKNGDGIDEQYRVCMVGDKLLHYEETDHVPFAAITPIIMTHRFHGRSIAELVMDIQRIKSTIQRQSLDNLYLTNNPRMAVLRNMVNLPDLMEVRPGGIVRMDQLDAVQPLTVPFVARDSFQVLSYFDDVKENRTGLTRYNQGMDSNTLNKTATGISRIMDASKERIELIARIFAETGVAQLFKGLLKLASTGESRVEIIRLRGKFIPMDPTEFAELYDVTVNVGLGTGNKAEELTVAQTILGLQEKGAALGLCRPIHLFNSASDLITLSGRKDVNRFFDKPDPAAPMPTPPDPNKVKVDGEVQKHQVSTQAALQENLTKHNLDSESTKYRIDKQAETELAVAKMRTDADLKASLYREAMKLVAQNMSKGVEVSTDKVAALIMSQVDKMLPEELRGTA